MQHFALRLSPKISQNAAPATKSEIPTSPNTAPATQNESHDWSASHMKRHFQCAEQAKSTSNLSKYCACHAKWIPWLIHTWNVIYNARSKHSQPPTSPNAAPATKFWVQDFSAKSLNCFHQYKDDSRIIRAWSEHDPRIKSSSRTRRFGDLTCPNPETILYWKIQHLALRLSPKMSRNAAPATKSHTPTSPNTAPATQNESHHWSASHMKRQLQCAEQQTANDKFTKYCACHAEWISWLIRVAYETSFTMRGASTVSLQPHQILRLPRNL